MGDFFKGWRRKIGIVTLLMACLFAVGWVRSVFISEVASALISDQAQLFIHSCDGMFWCGRNFAHESGYFSSQPIIRWVQYDDNKFNREGWESISWFWCFSDVRIVGHSSFMDRRSAPALRFDCLYFAMMPYWSVVIPMTLLSAFVLLTKPRKSTQNKIMEPIPEKVG